MCSIESGSAGQEAPADLAAQIAAAIDDLAAAAAQDGTAEPLLAARLAGAWALVTEADPDLARRAARYSRSDGRANRRA